MWIAFALRFKFLPLGLAAVVIMITTAAAKPQATDCGLFRPLAEHLRTTPKSREDAKGWTDWSLGRSELMLPIAETIYSLYRRGRWVSGTLEACLTDSRDLNHLREKLPRVFLRNTLQEIREMDLPVMAPWLREVEKISSGTELFRFRFMGHPHAKPTENLAGFHRGKRSIYMDFERIPPEQWTLVLLHETLHALDEDLLQGIRIFNDPATNLRLIEAERGERTLTHTDRIWIRGWLRAGLDRSFLAEVRAWTVTLFFYREWKKHGMQLPIDSLEAIIGERDLRAPEDSVTFANLLQILDRRFVDPDERFLAIPLIREILAAYRSDLRFGIEKPELGSLGRFIRR